MWGIAMNLKEKITRAAVFLTLCVLSAVGAAWRYSATSAQDFPPSLIELRADSPAQVGQPYIVDVFASIAAPAYGFGVQISYDPAVLQLDLQADVDTTQVPLRVGGVFISAQRIRNSQESDGTRATVDAVYTLLPPAEAVTGEGFIGRLTFTVLQPNASQVELVTPRLITLNDGMALDLPVTPSVPLAFSAAPASEVVQVVPQAITTPEVAVVAPAPAVESAPVVNSIIETVDTPTTVLAEMNRTSNLINAVAVGLLTLMAVLLGVITVSNVLDAITTARNPQQPVPARAFAYTGRPIPPRQPQPQPQTVRPTPAKPIYTPPAAPAKMITPDDEDMPTIPSRTHLADIRRHRRSE